MLQDRSKLGFLSYCLWSDACGLNTFRCFHITLSFNKLFNTVSKGWRKDARPLNHTTWFVIMMTWSSFRFHLFNLILGVIFINFDLCFYTLVNHYINQSSFILPLEWGWTKIPCNFVLSYLVIISQKYHDQLKLSSQHTSVINTKTHVKLCFNLVDV